MKRLIRNGWFLGLILTIQAPGLIATPSGQSSDPSLRIAVRLYNYAGMSPSTLAKAEAEASRVLSEAGLEIDWVDCPLKAADAVEGSSCKPSQRPTDLVLRILPRSMAQKVPGFNRFYGFAWPVPKGKFARLASVFHHRVEWLAGEIGGSRAVLLGHFMAHELGHLLLGLNSHSRNGIMRHPWRPQELRNAVTGRLRFSSGQAKRIRADVRQRVESVAAAPTSSGTDIAAAGQ